MPHLLFTFFFFVVTMVITAVVFGIWLIAAIFRFFIRLLVGPPAPPKANGRIICANPRCLASLPRGANFCRRCGKPLNFVPRPMRRAAIW